MIVRIQVIKVYDVETEGGDTTDHESVNAHVRAVEQMQSTDIEAEGSIVSISTDYAEVVGPSDEITIDASRFEIRTGSRFPKMAHSR